ncbi:MAG TPA: homoserine O-succinyltransferase [Stellaceae bacterium]|nr:homoserine O-succinyltransferase [Stellaceae bacterium]
MMPAFAVSAGTRGVPRFERPLLIGLVNNMPDAALQSTERQYGELFGAAMRNGRVRLAFFSLPEVPRGDAGKAHIAKYYEDSTTLWETPFDGLIVTGIPPRAAALEDEPYWPSLTRLVDWAERHTLSTVWSCLAAHAAVLHLDGIGRRALPQKLSGLYECIKASDHPLLAGAPTRWRLPHSRYNELPKEALIASGYRILSSSAAAGVDIFAKERASLFLFFQGHPEYDPGALLREYRRDVAAYLARRSDDYPRMPCGYFDKSEAAAFGAFRRRALARRELDLLESFPAAAPQARLAQTWHSVAVRLYANWLSYLADRRALRRHPSTYLTATSKSALAPAVGGDA